MRQFYLLSILFIINLLQAKAQPVALNTSFSGDGKVTTPFHSYHDEVRGIVIQPDGKIVAGGYRSDGGDLDFALARYNPDGSLDLSFDGDGKQTTGFFGRYDLAYSVALQNDGKIILAGKCINLNGANYDAAIVRYNTDGSLDASFSGDGKLSFPIGAADDHISAVAIQPDGKIVVAGYSMMPASPLNFHDFMLARINPDGTLDGTFGSGGKVITSMGVRTDEIWGLTLQADGKIVVGGFISGDNITTSALYTEFALARYNVNGTLDASFSSDGKLTTPFGFNSSIQALAIQPDGKILAAGGAGAGKSDFALARYHPDGSLDISFNGDGKLTTAIGTLSEQAMEIALQNDGKIVLAGSSFTPNDYDYSFARYLSDGTLDVSFDDDGKMVTDFDVSRDQCFALKISGSRLYAAGNSAGDFGLLAFQICDGTFDPLISDTDSDGVNDPCDEDDDGDGTLDGQDCAPLDGSKWRVAIFYIDNDNDGYDGGRRLLCYGASVPEGYKISTLGGDCDDNNALIHPGATEICNGLDDNCNAFIDDISINLICPENITVTSQSNVCGAIVNFVLPSQVETCPPVAINFNYTGQIETWTVPTGINSINIRALGAKGGSIVYWGQGYPGGFGASIEGDVNVNPGETLKILVGGRGIDASEVTGSVLNSGGGGGTFVWKSPSNIPVIIAGGGSGTGWGCVVKPGAPGLASLGGSGNGGIAGNLICGYNQGGGGGGGWLSNGSGTQSNNLIGGVSPLNGGHGGQAGLAGLGYISTAGGFGGGAGGGGNCGGPGGGGGYTGGNGGDNQGCPNYQLVQGGTSFNSGTNQINQTGVNNGEGQVVFTYGGSTNSIIQQIAGLPPGSTFPIGTTINTFQITDQYGQTSTCSFSVTVTDNENPTIICPQARTLSTSNNGLGDCSTTASFVEPHTNDNCGVESVKAFINGVEIDPSTYIFPAGTTSIIWVVRDINGNSASCNQTVIVNDDELPIVTTGLISNCYPTRQLAEQAAISQTVYSDNCTPNNNLQVTATTIGDCNAVITVTITDASNNSSSITYNTKIDNTKPVLNGVPQNLILNCNTILPTWNITASDNCDGVLPVSFVTSSTKGSNPSMGSFYNYQITNTWTATDACGNQESRNQLTTVQDTQSPTVLTPVGYLNHTVNCGDVNVLNQVFQLLPTATDNCAPAYLIRKLESDITTPGCGNTYTRVRTWTFKDPSGNVSLPYVQTITIVDNQPPTFISTPGSLDRTISCNNTAQIAAALTLSPVAIDMCSLVTITLLSDQTTPGCGSTFTHVKTWKAKDGCDNESIVFTQTVTVFDLTPPVVLSISPNIEYCYAGPTASYLIPSPTVSDNCTSVSTSFRITNSTGVEYRSGAHMNASGAFQVGMNTIHWTFTDACGNMVSRTNTVRINPPIEGSFNDVTVLPQGTSQNTLYFGYSPASLANIQITASGGTPFLTGNPYLYTWSGSGSAANFTIDPTDPTIITITAAGDGEVTFTVKVKDSKGCEVSFSKTIIVKDVRCGNALNRVQVCINTGNPNTVCIHPNAVANFLNTGAYLGACEAPPSMTKGILIERSEIDQMQGISIKVMPNPARISFTLVIDSELKKDKMMLTVTDTWGRVVEKKNNVMPGTSVDIGRNYTPGFYVAELSQGKNRKTVKLIKVSD